MKIITKLAWTPFTGLGAYGGFRGNRWLRNRITIFKQFVIPSLQAQTDKNFIHWVAWRPEERSNKYVQELEEYMQSLPDYEFVFTYGGLCMWDDKLEDKKASEKLVKALEATLPDLVDTVGDSDEVQVLLVPSDDLYDIHTFELTGQIFDDQPELQAVGYKKGFICNYKTMDILEYNPNTNPPFFIARFPTNIFLDPKKHYEYISMKRDEGKYKAGTPYASHEYIPNAFNMGFISDRGFMVGTHSENISTHFNHPFGGRRIQGLEKEYVIDNYGLRDIPNLKLPLSLRKEIIRRLPYRWQRKLRYLLGEKLFQRVYNFIRN